MRRSLVATTLALIAGALAISTTGCGEELDESWQEALTTAREVRELLVDGGDWTALASQYSDDPGSKEAGGELGDVLRGQMVPEFEEAVFTLQVDEISQPVKTTYGYHVIQVTQIDAGGQQTFQEVEDQIAAELLETAKQDIWSNWLTMKKAEIGLVYRDDLRPDDVAAPPAGASALPSDAVAKVGDQYLSTKDLTLRVEDTAAQYGLSKEADPDTYADMQAWVLENFIQSKVALQSAASLGVSLTDDEIQTEVSSVVQDYFGGDQAAFDSYLDERGVTMADFTQQIQEGLITQKVYEALTKDVPAITSEQAAAYYEKNKDSFYTEESRATRHILIAAGASQ